MGALEQVNQMPLEPAVSESCLDTKSLCRTAKRRLINTHVLPCRMVQTTPINLVFQDGPETEHCSN